MGIRSETPHLGQTPRLPAWNDFTFSLCPWGQRNLIPIAARNGGGRYGAAEWRLKAKAPLYMVAAAMLRGKHREPAATFSESACRWRQIWHNRRPAFPIALPEMSAMPAREESPDDGPCEIAIVGELAERETDIMDKLLAVPPGGECILYFNSPGGSAYAALALMSLLKLRGLKSTGIVIGECSSAAIWPFAACSR